MADTFTLQTKSYDGRYLKLTCTQTKKIDTNQSEVSWVLESVGGNDNYYYTGPTTLTIHGTRVYYKARTGAHEFPCKKGSVGGTLTINHAEDGQKSVAVSLKTAIYTKTVSEKAGTWTLDRIPRKATITDAADFTDEENPAVTYENLAGTAVSGLALCIALDEDLTNALPYQQLDKTGTSAVYLLSEADRQFLWDAMQDSNTLDVCFCLRTTIGETTYLDQRWQKVRLVHAEPILNPQFAEADIAVSGVAPGVYVRDLSNLQFAVGAQGRKGASIVSQSLSCGGVTAEGPEGTICDIRSRELVFTAVDSRGNRTELPIQIPFAEYVKPTCNIAKSSPDTDGNFTLQATGLCYTGAFPKLGDNQAYLFAQYCYKASGGDYTEWLPMTVTPEDNAYTAMAHITGLDYRKSYTFLCRVGDCLAEATSQETVVRAMPVFDWSENDFRFHVPVCIQGNDLADFVKEQGINGIWRYRKWAGGTAECWCTARVTVPAGLAATGAVYYSGPIYVDYPFSISDSRRFATVANLGILSAQLTESHTDKMSFRLICSNQNMAEKTVNVHIYVCGRWNEEEL